RSPRPRRRPASRASRRGTRNSQLWPLTMSCAIKAAMDGAMKWIGGATAAVLMLLGSAVPGGQALEAQEIESPDGWLTADDVLGADDAVTAPEAPAFESAAVVQPLPAPPPAEDSPFTIKRILP